MNKFIEFIISLFTRILQAINIILHKLNKLIKPDIVKTDIIEKKD